VSSREFPERPIIGVGGITIARDGDLDRVLLVRRASEPLLGQWSVPGGALELGESLKQGVERELLEETGIEVEALEVVEILDRVLQLPDGRVQYHYVLIDYLCRPRGAATDPKPCEPKPGSDASDARWIARGELGEYGLRPDVLAVIEKAFRLAC
jgi:ADP-ribose pyrophosphatase YjhB (NUDIX family)